MRIFDYKEYNEKLKIDAINLKELDELPVAPVAVKHYKNQLGQFDIVKIKGNFYLVFLEDSLATYSSEFKKLKNNEYGMFWFYGKGVKSWGSTHFMCMSNYDIDLKYAKNTHDLQGKPIISRDKDWDVEEVYIRPKDKYVKFDDVKEISQEFLKTCIKDLNYKKIVMK